MEIAKLKWALLGVILLGAVYGIYEKGYADAKQKYELVEAQKDTKNAVDSRDAEHEQRSREQSFGVVRDAQEAATASGMVSLGFDTANLAASNQRLRQELDATNAKLSAASKLASVSSVNADAAKAAMVLSQLLDKATTELGRVAGTADEWRLKGEQCEKLYDDMRSR